MVSERNCHDTNGPYRTGTTMVFTFTTKSKKRQAFCREFHFPVYLKVKDNNFKAQLENDLYLPVPYHEFRTKAQPFEQLQQNKVQQIKQNHSLFEPCPSLHHTDVTLITNKTEPITPSSQNASYAELINTIKFSLPALVDFIHKSPEIYNYFYTEQTEIIDTLLYEAQQHGPVIRQLLLWKKHKKSTSSLH